MKKNLIMTAAIGFQVSQLQFFIKSLRKYYKEDVCVIIGSKDNKIEEELLKNGARFIGIVTRNKLFARLM